MPNNNSKLEGVVNELIDLFNTQNQILHQMLDQNEQSNISPAKIKKVEDDFNFLVAYTRENITVDGENRYIGKMLLQARRQAEEIVATAEAEAQKIVSAEPELPEMNLLIVEEATEVFPEETTDDLVREEVSEAPTPVLTTTELPQVSRASKSQFVKTKEVHQKYRESLDGILKEIDNFLERD